MRGLRWYEALRWLGAITIAVIAVMRATIFFAPLPVFDVDPAYFDVLGGLSAAGSLGLDVALLLGCAAALLGESMSRRHIHGRLLVLALIPVPIVLWHGAAEADDLWRGATWVSAAIACATVANLGRDPAMRVVLIAVLAAVLVPLLVRGAGQVTFEYQGTIEQFEQNRDAIFAEKGWAPDSSNALIYERRLRHREPTAWSITTNVFGSFMALGVVLWIGLAWASIRARLPSGSTGLLVLLAAASAAGLWMTGSKGAIVAALGGIGLLAAGAASGSPGRIVQRWGPWLCAASVFVAIGAIALRGAALPESFAGEKSLLFRWHYLTAAMGIVGDEPLVGVGPDGFQAAYLEHRPPRNPEEVGSAHSVFVDWLSALGVSAIAWIGLVVILLGRAGAVLGSRGPPETAPDGPTHRAILMTALAVAALGLVPSIVLETSERDPLTIFVRLLGCVGFVAVAILVAGAVKGCDRRLVDWALAAGVVALFVHGQIEMTMTRPGSAVWACVLLGLAGGARSGRFVWPGAVGALAVAAIAGWLTVAGAHAASRQERVMVDAAQTLWPIAEGQRAIRLLAKSADYSIAAPAAVELDAALASIAPDDAEDERRALARYVNTGQPVERDVLRRIDRRLRGAEPGLRGRAAERLLDAAALWPTRQAVRLAAADQLLAAASLVEERSAREGLLREALAALDEPLAAGDRGRAASFAITTHLELARLTADPAHEQAALDLAESMVEADPNGLGAWKRLGDLAWAFGRADRAREAYARTLEIDRNFALDPLKQLNDTERATVAERPAPGGDTMMIAYTVRCTFDDPSVAAEWIDWLEIEHLADVCAAGALSADIVRLDGDPVTCEVRYRFASREAFDAYERDHAPRLRAEGLERFPLERGLSYARSVGEITIAHSA